MIFFIGADPHVLSDPSNIQQQQKKNLINPEFKAKLTLIRQKIKKHYRCTTIELNLSE